MPVYDKGYRTFDGTVKRRFRWATMVAQEWSIMRKRRMFWVLLTPSILISIGFAMYIYIIDIIGSARDHPMAEAAQQLPFREVDSVILFNFIGLQVPFVFILTILVGSGLIANDFRYHLVDIYFSKPLSWWDYVLGKLMTLVAVGLGITLLPACIGLLLHFAFVPEFETLKKIWWLPLPVAAYSLIIILPTALAVLATSSFFMSQRFAAITVFMLAVVNNIFGGVLPPLLVDGEHLHVIAILVAINRLGEAVFNQPNLAIPEVSVFWSAVFWGATCFLAFLVVARKARKAGAAE